MNGLLFNPQIKYTIVVYINGQIKYKGISIIDLLKKYGPTEYDLLYVSLKNIGFSNE